MSERKKDLFFLAVLLCILVLYFSKILFTGRIVRAPDIINEFYWGVKGYEKMGFLDLFKVNLRATWDLYVNSGLTVEGGTASLGFLFFQKLVFWLIPAPASVAWYMVLHLFIGGAGVYCLCRSIGTSRPAAFLGGLVFAVSPEIASLINAGHVMKIATISFAPWAFYAFEKGLRTRRLIWFLTTGLILAYQFFHTHWQISYYTCLAIGVYGIIRTIGIIAREGKEHAWLIPRLAALNLVVAVFFLTTAAMSLAPLASWSVDTTRGVASGANQGKGGLDQDEAMSWSLPPEELVTFVIPGFFGFSRQEAGENPRNIHAYYWGRMNFTQTSDYLGLLPWLLLPLPLMFRRDRYTWIACTAVVVGVLFSLGKYTPFYRLLFDYFPGINHFRVPKMMMFIPVLGLGVLAARGMDLLLDVEVRASRLFRRYLYGILSLPLLLFLVLGLETAWKEHWINALSDLLIRPTRYEQGPQLAVQRWNNLVIETGVAVALAAAYAFSFLAFSRKWISVAVLPAVLIGLYLADTARVNAKFLFLVAEPHKANGTRTPVMEYLLNHNSPEYRVLPMNGADPMQYATNRIPVMFTSNPVQQRRWQDFLDAFTFRSSMPDMMNLKYLVYDSAQYEREKVQVGDAFVPVFRSPDGNEVVLENRKVLPKAWLVPAAGMVENPGMELALLRNPGFDPRRIALVETPSSIPLAESAGRKPVDPGKVMVTRYEGERITVEAEPKRNVLLILGEKFSRGWYATVDCWPTEIVPVNHVLRGVYLRPGAHRVEFFFDPLPFKIGKWLTLASFALFAAMLGLDVWMGRVKSEG
jgi:hypothetical protein